MQMPSAALELADAMTAMPADVPDALFARLRTHFDEPQLVELAATAALENFRARFNRAFRIEPNSLYCPLPGHGSPPDLRWH
ncbi:MAG: carboxymuconolactone decarboxylase family protein [Chloroflexota bacterium]